jgi:hypothetical protein
MFQLILYGILAAGLAFGGAKIWSGFTGQYVAEGKQAQLEADQKVIDALKAERDAAKADREQAQSALEQQNVAMRRMEETTQAAQAAAREAGIKYAAAVAKNAARITELAKIAATPAPDGRTCNEVLDATDRILRSSQKAVQ